MCTQTERYCSWCTGKPEGGEVLNLHWAASRLQTHYNKASIFKSSHKILVIFVPGWFCPGRQHSCFPLHRWTSTCFSEWTLASRRSHSFTALFCLSVLSVNPLICGSRYQILFSLYICPQTLAVKLYWWFIILQTHIVYIFAFKVFITSWLFWNCTGYSAQMLQVPALITMKWAI